MQVDAIALQEVDSNAGVEGGIDQFEYLARATEMQSIAGPTLSDRRGQYGNAILTRLPILETQRVDLSVPGREPRGALGVDLDASGQRLTVIATHLGLRWKERRKQVSRLVDFVDRMSSGPLVLLGDMNEWIPVGHSLGPVFRVFGTAPRILTYPAGRPLLPLDRIWCRPFGALVEVRAHDAGLAKTASDHLPLRAELLVGRGSLGD
jgi:endonuclease/exonuclease/phosphatase family metal-dependent hydrolase